MTNQYKLFILAGLVFILLCFSRPVFSIETVPPKTTINGISLNNPVGSTVSTDGKGSYLLFQSAAYQIVYLPKYNNEFLIDIVGFPFATVRDSAEKKLLSILGVSEKDACSLYVVISTSIFVNPEEAKKNYSLSFCEQKKNADINHDGMINTIDYALIITHYGLLGKNIKADVNNDGVVNALDLSIVLGKLGEKI